MKRNDLQPWQVALMAWIFTLLSLICAFLIFVFPSSQYVRREFGSIGFMSAWLGTTIGVWGALRTCSRPCWLAGIMSLMPFLIWVAVLIQLCRAH